MSGAASPGAPHASSFLFPNARAQPRPGLAGAAQAAVLTIAQPADIRSINPGVNRDNTTDGVVLHMVEGLVGYREDGTVAPLLAQSVSMSDDGLTYTFTLREG